MNCDLAALECSGGPDLHKQARRGQLQRQHTAVRASASLRRTPAEVGPHSATAEFLRDAADLGMDGEWAWKRSGMKRLAAGILDTTPWPNGLGYASVGPRAIVHDGCDGRRRQANASGCHASCCPRHCIGHNGPNADRREVDRRRPRRQPMAHRQASSQLGAFRTILLGGFGGAMAAYGLRADPVATRVLPTVFPSLHGLGTCCRRRAFRDECEGWPL